MDEKSVAVETAIRAGEILKEKWNRVDLLVFEKGTAINPVTEIDQRSETLVKESLSRAFPEYGILTEESDEIPGHVQARWIIDPLDGTTNYIRGYPFVAVSIGLEIEGVLSLGVVYNPILDEIFIGQKGQGATLNGKPIQVSRTSELGSALLASGFPYDAWENSENNTAEWAKFISLTRSLRCDGSSALDLCKVACGQLDGYWEKGIYPWDMAAGIVIVREAGGLLSDYSGGNNCLVLGEVVAANEKLQKRMIKVLQRNK
jgi:myo-inositol-1(or 4)-monophosphatase